jgi:muramoyltetrapeptide carboxypeptidase
MDSLLSERLSKGDKIGIVSPSGAISKDRKPQLKNGIEYLRSLGFRVELAKNALKIEDSWAGTPEERAKDINSLFSNREVAGIICSQGGSTANSCLPFLDFSAIRKNPKIFMGISDITVLLNSFYSKSGLVTFHGNDVIWGFGKNPTKYDKDEFVHRLIQGKVGRLNKNSKWRSIRSGSGQGRLIGGNINCLLELAGTRFQPDFRDSIIFLEAYDVTSGDCNYMLSQLQQIGAFEKVKGVLIGYIWGLQASEKRRKQTQMEDLLKRMTSEYDFPIVKCNDFGHNCPNTVLPVGAKAKLDADGTEPELEILEHCVK